MKRLLDFAWHDARLLHIELDRSNPGSADTVRMIVEWAEGEPRPPERRSMIEFTNCYRLEAAMNFGIICHETFLQASPAPDHPEIARIQAWSGLTDLFCWVFETNSTGSMIKVIARDVTVRPLT